MQWNSTTPIWDNIEKENLRIGEEILIKGEPKMGVSGRIIKYVRNQKGVTQESLAEGICSVSYLSKVENETLEPSQEILDLLGERLQIAPGERHGERCEVLKKELFHWYHLMKHDLMDKAGRVYRELSDSFPHPIYEDLNDYFYLFRFRYEVAERKEAKVHSGAENLKQWLPLWKGDRRFLAYKMLGFYYDMVNEHRRALDYFLSAENQTDRTLDEQDPELLYFTGRCYLKIGLPVKAISHVEGALKYYQDSLSQRCVLKCKLLLARCYHKLGEDELAFAHLNKIISLEDKGVEEEWIGKAYYLLGLLTAEKGNTREALSLLYQALEYLHGRGEEYVSACYHLAKIHQGLDHFEEAAINIQEGLDYTADMKQNYRLYILEAVVSGTIDSLACLNKIENEILPYFYEHDHREECLEALELLAEVFLEKGNYKKSATLYHQACHYRKQGADILHAPL